MPPNYGAGLAAKYANAIAAQNGTPGQQPPPPPNAADAELERQFLAGAQTSAAPPPWEIQSGAPNPVANIPQIGASEGMSVPSAPAPTAPAPAQPAQPLLLPGRAYAGGPNAIARDLAATRAQDDANLARMGAADAAEQEAIAAGADQMAGRMMAEQGLAQESMAREKAAQEEYRRQEAATIDRLRSEADEVAKQTPREKTRGQIFGEMSTGNQIAASIGLALGAFGQAITGRDNPALAHIDKLQEQDLANQKMRYESAKTAAAKRETLYGRMLERYQDPVVAERQTRAFQADQTARYASQIANTTKGELARTNAAKLAATYDQKALEQRRAIDQQIRANTSSGGVTGPRLNPLAISEHFANGGDPKAFDEAVSAGMKAGLSRTEAAAAYLASGSKGATGAQDKEIRAETADLSKREVEAGVPDSLTAINNAKITIGATDGAGLGIVGRTLASGGQVGGMIMSEDMLRTRQAVDMAKVKFRKAITGSGGSMEEANMLWDGFMGQARDKAGILRGLDMAEAEVNARRATIQAGASAKGRAAYQANLAATRAPTSASEAGFKPAGSK